ncbi:hypothetical protein BDV23DRAFT_95897 [Aspergillus alliaceus]|uniref:Uncharacterized protein n=1 Tax=Petromyces alliaceus TaxID=209559 RepID=A0A5N7CMP5_PETAA|nr:hypothetical protein BDV23DRAFT_95897 [Aspergillus alliaceus]
MGHSVCLKGVNYFQPQVFSKAADLRELVLGQNRRTYPTVTDHSLLLGFLMPSSKLRQGLVQGDFLFLFLFLFLFFYFLFFIFFYPSLCCPPIRKLMSEP